MTEAIQATASVAAVSPPQPNAAGDAAIIQVIPTTSPQDEATTELVRQLREVTIPAATPEGIVHVGGGTATFIDLSEPVTNALPWFIGAVVLLSFLLLMVVFRLILVPLKAALLNLLSIGAAYGVICSACRWTTRCSCCPGCGRST